MATSSPTLRSRLASRVRGFASWMGRVPARVRAWFRGEESSDDAAAAGRIFPELVEIRRTTTILDAEHDDIRSEDTDKSIIKMKEKARKEFRDMGLEDGKNGTSYYDVKSLASTVADYITDTLKRSLSGKVENLTALKSFLEAREENGKAEFERADTYWRRTSAHRANNKRYYSRTLGAFYLLVAAGIIIADLPLAVDVAEDGFGLPGAQDPDARIEFLFTTRFFEVIARNWQPLGLALGIALSAFYIKVFYDEFVGWPASRNARQMRNVREEFRHEESETNEDRIERGSDEEARSNKETDSGRDIRNGENGESEPSKTLGSDTQKQSKEAVKAIEGELRFRWWVKIVILVFTLTALILIGYLRALTEVETGGYPVLYWLYPMITVLLPLIGGVFASIGFSCIQNVSEWHATRKEREEASLKLRIVEHAIERCRQELKSHQVKLDSVKADNFQEELTTTLKLAYDRGYDRGILHLPSVRPGTIEHAERIRRKRTLVRMSNLHGRRPEDTSLLGGGTSPAPTDISPSGPTAEAPDGSPDSEPAETAAVTQD